MTDAEREAQIRHWVVEGGEQPPSFGPIACRDLLRLLDEARAESSRLRDDASDIEVNYARELSRLKAEIARLRTAT